MNSDQNLALELVRYRVISKPYSSWRAIIAETGESDTAFLLALKHLHGITIDKTADPILHITYDTQQQRLLLEEGVPSPTFLQMLLTAKAFALDVDEIPKRFTKALKEANPEQP